MRLNIPFHLLKYKEHLKKSSHKVVFSSAFSFKKVGLMEKNDNYRELYICYNPYTINIRLDINQFKSDKNIYKLYPPVIDIPSNEMFAFMVFSTNKSKLEFDLETLSYNQKNRIKNNLKKLKEVNLNNDITVIEGDFNYDINSTILLDDFKVDATTMELEIESITVKKLLGNKQNKFKSSGWIEYSPINRDIIVDLKSIKNKRNLYKFNFIFENKEDINYLTKGFKISFFNLSSKKVAIVQKEIKIRGFGRVEVLVKIKEKNILDLLNGNLKIDLEIM